jgi:hypothetical protein
VGRATCIAVAAANLKQARKGVGGNLPAARVRTHARRRSPVLLLRRHRRHLADAAKHEPLLLLFDDLLRRALEL